MAEVSAAPRKPFHPLAELYGRWALNPLVDVAHAIAHDVAVRPQMYRELSPNLIPILNDFRFKLGADSEWPNAFQRTLNFKVLFNVALAGPSLREAALLYTRHHGEQRDGVLLDAFRDAVSAFRAQLKPLDGNALGMLERQTRGIFERAVAVFQDPTVARAFGLPPVTSKDWPLTGNVAGDGAYLVAAIVHGLRQAACMSGLYRRLSRTTPTEQRLVPVVNVVLPQDKFVTLQKAAYFGAHTISTALDPDAEGDELRLISSAYKWTLALQHLMPDVTRAWKDLDYRAQLTDLEWGMAPNPAGDAVPLSVGGLSAETYTAHGEICCCSGDLDCDTTAIPTDFCSEFCGTATWV